jgi:hypothetical protein
MQEGKNDPQKVRNFIFLSVGFSLLRIKCLLATAALWVRIQTSLENTKWAS